MMTLRITSAGDSMAWKANEWCFIHIPKTSGGWVTRNFSGVTRDGSAHGFPTRWDYSLIFTVVREPADWLRSVWANRIQERWQQYPREVPWQAFCNIANQYQTSDFNQFARNIVTGYPGIVGWLFGVYSPPGVKVVRYGEELHQFLRDLGCTPDTIKPHNVSSTHDFEMLPDTRHMIYEAEWFTYLKYGWREDGSYR